MFHRIRSTCFIFPAKANKNRGTGGKIRTRTLPTGLADIQKLSLCFFWHCIFLGNLQTKLKFYLYRFRLSDDIVIYIDFWKFIVTVLPYRVCWKSVLHSSRDRSEGTSSRPPVTHRGSILFAVPCGQDPHASSDQFLGLRASRKGKESWWAPLCDPLKRSVSFQHAARCNTWLYTGCPGPQLVHCWSWKFKDELVKVDENCWNNEKTI